MKINKANVLRSALACPSFLISVMLVLCWYNWEIICVNLPIRSDNEIPKTPDSFPCEDIKSEPKKSVEARNKKKSEPLKKFKLQINFLNRGSSWLSGLMRETLLGWGIHDSNLGNVKKNSAFSNSHLLFCFQRFFLFATCFVHFQRWQQLGMPETWNQIDKLYSRPTWTIKVDLKRTSKVFYIKVYYQCLCVKIEKGWKHKIYHCSRKVVQH